MPLKKTMPMAPGTRPDPRHETTYQASRGGHVPTPQKPTPGTPKP
ncbi:hypothetical protein [Streptomyces cyaneofuscatus]|nr:hypothetical protein [Streptomyces cyaneofuscatus]